VLEVMEAATVQDALDFAYDGPTGRRSWSGANRLGFRTRLGPDRAARVTDSDRVTDPSQAQDDSLTF
jgi:hypothetical protein